MWKEIKGNQEIYLISDNGEIKTKDRIGARGYKVKSKIHKPHKNSSGYYRVSMNIDGIQKEYFVHRLVAYLFVQNPNKYEFVNHIDGNKENNKAENLEWCTRSQNERHAWRIGLKTKDMVSRRGEQHGMHKLTQKEVNYIRRNHIPYDKEFGSKPLAIKFKVNPQTITEIVHNRSWIVGATND